MSKSGPKPKPPIDRIRARMEITATGCWEWTGSRNQLGYGRMYMGSRSDGSLRNASVHRVAYEELVGPIPEGLVLDHLCRNPPCCNPDHLEPVTQQVNVAVRGVGPIADQLRQTHCKRGHEFTPENTRVVSGGKRDCRTCHNQRRKAYRARKATQTATLATLPPHTGLGVERESGSRLSESNRRPIHYE